MIGPEHEQARPAEGAGFADAVTFSFADSDRDWFGLARLGLSISAGGERHGSALAILFRGREPVSAIARGGLAIAGDPDWAELEVPGVRATVEAPLERWRVSFGGDDGTGFDLAFSAVSAPAALAGADRVARLGGMEGYEQLCTVEGDARVGGETHRVSGLGQRGHAWGAPDWDSLELSRSVSAWLGPEAGGVTLTAVRPAAATSHEDEAIWCAIVHDGEAVAVDDARLSTTYDAEGRQRRVGLELWLDGEEYAHRAAGEVLCGSTLDLGQLRLDLAFMRFHSEGREGVGRYDVLRRA